MIFRREQEQAMPGRRRRKLPGRRRRKRPGHRHRKPPGRSAGKRRSRRSARNWRQNTETPVSDEDLCAAFRQTAGDPLRIGGSGRTRLCRYETDPRLSRETGRAGKRGRRVSVVEMRQASHRGGGPESLRGVPHRRRRRGQDRRDRAGERGRHLDDLRLYGRL